MFMEIWKDVAGFEDRFQISNYGNVRRKSDGKSPIVRIDCDGYEDIHFKERGRTISVHPYRWVAENFIPNPLNKPQVNHIDGNKLNNHVDNLEWVTSKENIHHAHRIGLYNNSYTPVLQYNLDGSFIREWRSIAEASNFLGCKSKNNIAAACNGRYTQSHGFIWKYKFGPKKQNRPKTYSSKNMIKTYQYSLDGELIAIHNSTKEAERSGNGFDATSIQRCINGTNKTHGGYIWSKQELTSEECSMKLSNRVKGYYESASNK